MAARSRLAFAALAFALAAALSSWNPLAAPFGLVVGIASIILAGRAFQRGGRRWLSSLALVLAVGAVGVSGFVLSLTAGVGREFTGGAVVDAPAPADARRTLDDAAERTKSSRSRAREELDRVIAPRR